MQLYLDHFYVGIPEQCFAEYAILGDLIPGTEVRTTCGGDQTWSGVYPRAASGVYMELLQRAGDLSAAGLGVAVSELGRETNVLTELQRAFPRSAWESKEIRFQGVEPWFHWIAERDPDPSVFTWAMEYQGSRRAERQQRIGQANTPIAHFSSVSVRFPPRLFGPLSAAHHWLPGTRHQTADCYTLTLPCYAAEDFTVMARPDAMVQFPEVERITAQIRPDRCITPYQGKTFAMRVDGTQLSFEFTAPA